jgi:hypothetical protein
MALQKRRSRFLVKFESGGIKMMTNHSNSVPKFAEGHESLEHFETLHKTLNETILSVKMTSKSHLAGAAPKSLARATVIIEISGKLLDAPTGRLIWRPG